MSRSHIGMQFSAEHKRKIGLASKGRNIGRKHSAAVLAELRGRKHTEEEKAKMRGHTPWNKGKHLSGEHRRKLSLARKKRLEMNIAH